jgi:hypothetical protein
VGVLPDGLLSVQAMESTTRIAKGRAMTKTLRWAAVAAFCIFAFTIQASGQTPPVQIVMDPVIVQKNAPIQIVSIKADGDNTLATVVVKNATDRYIQVFNVVWTVLRPANCATNGPAPGVQQLMSAGHQIYVKAPGPDGGDRVFKPHEQIEITVLSLSRKDLLDLAKKNNAKKLRVQVGVAWVNFTAGDHFTDHDGPPDWFDPAAIKMGILDDDDATKQACD